MYVETEYEIPADGQNQGPKFITTVMMKPNADSTGLAMKKGMTNFDEPVDDQVEHSSLRPSPQLTKMADKGDFRIIQTSSFISVGGKPIDRKAEEVQRHEIHPNQKKDYPSLSMQGATISPNLKHTKAYDTGAFYKGMKTQVTPLCDVSDDDKKQKAFSDAKQNIQSKNAKRYENNKEVVNEYLETEVPLFTGRGDSYEIDANDMIVEENYNAKLEGQPSLREMRTVRDIFSVKTLRNLRGDAESQEIKGTSLLSNFRHSRCCQKAKFIFGLVFAFLNGCLGALHALILSRLITALNPYACIDIERKDISQLTQCEDTDRLNAFWEVVQYALPICGGMMVLSFLQYYMLKSSALNLEFSMRSRFYRSVFAQDAEFFESTDLENLSEQATKKFQELTNAIGEKVGLMTFAIGAMLGGLVLALIVSSLFTIALLFTLPTLLVFYMCFSACCYGKRGEKDKVESGLRELVSESMRAIRLIIATGQEERVMRNLSEFTKRTHKASMEAQGTKGWRQMIKISLLFLFLLYAWGVFGVFIENDWINPTTKEPHTVSECYTCMEALMYCFAMFPILLRLVPDIKSARLVGAELGRIIDRTPKIKNAYKNEKDNVEFINFADGVRFQEVTFKYPNAPSHAHPILQGISFKIEPGKRTALVGGKSSGKTAILKLINRLYDPEEGQLLFGGESIVSLELDSFRQQVSFIDAQPSILMGTIKDNLLLGKNSATDGQLFEVLAAVNADFVGILDLGTIIGDYSQGVELTPSQMQRICIARAIISKPKLLLIDDILKGIDPLERTQVELAIEGALKWLGPDTTVVAVTDKLPTIKSFDHLIYIKNPYKVISAAKDSNQFRKFLKHALEDHSELDQESLGFVDCDLSEDSNTVTRRQRRFAKPDILVEIEQEKDDVQRYFYNSTARVIEQYRTQWHIYLVFVLAMINSLAYPIIGYFGIRFLVLYFSWGPQGPYQDMIGNDQSYQEEKVTLFIGFGVTLACTIALHAVQKIVLGVISFKIETTLRSSLLRSILHQDVTWFDKLQNQSGQLIKLLTSQVTYVSEGAIKRAFLIFESVCICVIGVIISAIICWEQTVFVIACSPVILLSIWGWQETIFNQAKPVHIDQSSTELSKQGKRAQKVIKDWIKNYQAVITISESHRLQLNQEYERLLSYPIKSQITQSCCTGLYHGYSQAGRNLFLLVSFIAAIGLSLNELHQPVNDILVATIVLFVTFTVAGSKIGNMPSLERMEASSRAIFDVIDEESTIDVRKEEAQYANNLIQLGKIEFINAELKYANSKKLVLSDLTMEIPAQNRVALVGEKGCGKNDLAGVLTMFYKLQGGQIKIDGRMINEYSLRRLRSQIQLVPQVPVIFNASIKANISFGRTDVSAEQIYRAAYLAQALTFIEESNETDDRLRVHFINVELKSVLTSLLSMFKRFDGLLQVISDKLKDRDPEMLQFLLDIFKYADLTTYQEINEAPVFCIDLIIKARTMASPNVSWIDLIQMFEWDLEFQKIRQEDLLEEEKLQSFLRFSERSQYSFDLRAVADALKLMDISEIKGKEFLIQGRIAKLSMKTRPIFALKQSHRKEELVSSMIDKKRDADGAFRLGPGFNRICGKNGCNLTESQKQRLAIAQAILKDPKIMILEDGTAALDQQGREAVEAAWQNAMQGRTTILISQQESQIAKCDFLYVLHDGRLIEKGPCKDLIANPDSEYSRFKKGK